MSTHLVDLARGELVCRNCQAKRRIPGATIAIPAFVTTCNAFVLEHAGCQPGDALKRELDRLWKDAAAKSGARP